ncbi:MAG: hypothetical protein R3B51_04795 [Thermodesulfobacteriota bacterium]
MTHEKVMELILDHYNLPVITGRSKTAPIICSGGNNGCGDLITVYIDAGPDGAVRRMGLRAMGAW